MKRAATALLGVALALGLIACGGGGGSSSTESTQPTSAIPSSGPPTGYGRYTQLFGEAASPAVRSQVENTLLAFYAANSAADGEKACATLTVSAQQAVVASSGAPKALRAKGCGPAYTAQMEKVPVRLRHLNKGVLVNGVRVKGDKGFVLFRSAVLLPSELPIRREGGNWKLDSISASPLHQ